MAGTMVLVAKYKAIAKTACDTFGKSQCFLKFGKQFNSFKLSQEPQETIPISSHDQGFSYARVYAGALRFKSVLFLVSYLVDLHVFFRKWIHKLGKRYGFYLYMDSIQEKF